ncbi:gas vesicle protein GvpG [Streptomyces sp. AN091965]|uniref:gas vesicle protein GvpG n=1 Tax=Streptomyces sp. AN091965 TaxID=2927803 RepID=UPI001F61DFDB|nr:gas vesicle protein GvpG [Streptomyces sp. AN091965]MCI3933972.1 gas vesicle protein GvpG [Streptomyces sp. AN091965]
MGLVGELLALPLAPARGTLWVIRQVVAEAERQYYDPSAIRAELARLTERVEAGEIDAAEFDRREDELLARLGYGARQEAAPETVPGAAPEENRTATR